MAYLTATFIPVRLWLSGLLILLVLNLQIRTLSVIVRGVTTCSFNTHHLLESGRIVVIHVGLVLLQASGHCLERFFHETEANYTR